MEMEKQEQYKTVIVSIINWFNRMAIGIGMQLLNPCRYLFDWLQSIFV